MSWNMQILTTELVLLLSLISLVVVLWRSLSVIEKTSSSSTRASEKERRDYIQMITQLLEKRDTNEKVGQVNR